MNNIEIIQTIGYARNLMKKMESSVHEVKDLKNPVVGEFLSIFKGNIGDREKIIYHYGIEYERRFEGKFLRIVCKAEGEWLKEAFKKCVIRTGNQSPLEHLSLDVEGRKLNLDFFMEEIEKFVEKLEKSEMPLEVAYKKNIENMRMEKMSEDF